MAHKINLANIKDWAANYDGELFDGILCDPPYHLVSMTKRWGSDKAHNTPIMDTKEGGVFARSAKGFMGKDWDGVDENGIGIAQDPEMWALLYKLLKPGAHLLAFSGSRTYHRMAVAIEDAGFEIRDMIEWVYGSGFPKSLNIAKQLDKMVTDTPGVSSEKTDNAVGLNGATDQPSSWDNNEYGGGNAKCPICNKWFISGSPCVCPKEKVSYKTNEAQYWEGYGTALKPAHEPCVLARKPIEGNVAQNCLKHGTGGLNIDGSRVTTEDNLNGGMYSGSGKAKTVADHKWGFEKRDGQYVQPTGRFPANLIHDGSDEVLEVFPDSKSTGGTGKISLDSNINLGGGNNYFHFNDSGSAARFFYTAKSSKSERNAGLDGFEIKEALFNNTGLKNNGDGTERPQGKFQNHHPTVKPLALTKYLATLIKPPKGGRLLVPFSGSGSEMIGALQAGWEYVEGVELTEEYIPIAEARIKYWLDKIQEEKDNEQPSLFDV